MRTERITFEGFDGDALSARLDLPDSAPRAYALFAHCFTCSKDLAAARRIAQGLTERDIAVLRFDFTGLGHSEGEFANTNFSSNVADLKRAAGWLAREHGPASLLIGHSLGGAAVIAAAADLPEVKAVVTLNAPHDPAHVLDNLGSSLATIEAEGAAEVSLAGRSFRIERSFVEDVRASALDDALAHLHKALLVIHAPRDEIVGVDNAARIFLAAKHPKSFVTLDDADHLISRDRDALYTAQVIAAWAERYLPEPPRREIDTEGSVLVAEADADGFLQNVHVGGHHLLADEPRSLGGTDRGPSPYQLVSAGLGACTAMTIRMYARRKNIALNHVSVDIRHDKIHAKDCADCEQASGKVDVFTRLIHLEGDLSPAERAKLLEIADKCPVHRTLEGQIRISTELADLPPVR
ncbi:MAG: alpha/beta fold hydrolase [Neomegalonema sp.]|nr:alpha/beta fold hydrolase [Neomegalonema sp.]